MQVFVSAVETGSLSAAGRELGMPLPTISRKIAELEAHIKTRLLNRSTRKLTLTDAGKSYLASCRQILESVETAEAAAAGEYSAPKGKLMITAPIVMGRMHVLPVVLDFIKAYPDVDVQLVMEDRMLDLLEEHIDLAVRIGELPDSSQIATRVGTIRQVVCASPEYLKKNGTPEKLADITLHECITLSKLSSPDVWAFRNGRKAELVKVHSRLVINTAEAAIDAAIAGAGLVSALSYQIDSAIEAGKLQIVLEKFEPSPMPVSLIFTGQRMLPLKLRAFLDFSAPRLRERLGFDKAVKNL